VTLIAVMAVAVRAAVVAGEVAGGGAFDFAGAVAGSAGGQQGAQDCPADDGTRHRPQCHEPDGSPEAVRLVGAPARGHVGYGSGCCCVF